MDAGNDIRQRMAAPHQRLAADPDLDPLGHEFLDEFAVGVGAAPSPLMGWVAEGGWHRVVVKNHRDPRPGRRQPLLA